MEMEFPEIYNGSVVIPALPARPAAARRWRSRAASLVWTPRARRWASAERIQAIVAELNGEKVDVVLWNEDAAQFVAEALSPAEVIEVRIDEEHRIANVIVPSASCRWPSDGRGRTPGWRPS